MRSYSMLELEKRTADAIHNHFRLSSSKMLLLTWLKGIWTGILFSLVLHFLVTH